MTGPTIDHMFSVVVFLGAILLFIGLFNQTIQTAILYQRHRYLATKCSDLLDNVLLNPGYPLDWGTSNSTPTCFGLQDPEFQQYRLNPFSLMRLLSFAGDKVYYNRTGEWYSNVSWGLGGGYMLLSESDCINYSTASKLLGVNGIYGFQLTISPTLTVNVREVQSKPLVLEVQVMGPGLPLSGADLNYLMFWTQGPNKVECISGNTTTDSLGRASLSFPEIDVDKNQTAYSIIVTTHISGLHGIGYASSETTTKAGNIIPFIEDYVNGTILLAHKWGKNDPDGSQGALHFNASFYCLPDNFVPIKVDVLDSTGLVNYGVAKAYERIQIPAYARAHMGFLIVTYWTGNEYGMVIMPWGIGTIGMSVVFGGDPSLKEWVSTDIRQVIVNGIAYQAKLALWSLEGYGVIG